MADRFKPCSVEGCKRNAHHSARGRKGFCGMHYARLMRHGDPLSRRKVGNGEAVSYLYDFVLSYDGDDCLIWPFSRNEFGHAKVSISGKTKRAARVVCEEINGPAPNPKDEAAHSCGNGHLGCVTPRHLSWKSRSANQMDRVEHGTSNRGRRHGMVRLTEDQVREIRRLRGFLSQKCIGKMFGINQSHVRDIHRRKIWAWLE